ncbi:MAG: DegV family protein [Clostridia bacterium]|nr:DegV family protein [Clostridia bacterium]
MAKIRIVTDSTADLPRELVEQYNITVVPLNVIFGEETYLESVDLTADDFYRKLAQSTVLPTTSQPSPGEFVTAYEPLVAEGAEIISLHISGLMSGTVQAARLAQGMLKYPKLEVVDTQGVSILLGAMVLEAARAVERGCTFQEVKELVASFKSRHQVFFTVDTLDYLQRGGRIAKAAAFLGTLLNIKPVLTIKDGEIYPCEKVRGLNRAFDRMVDITLEEFGGDTPLRCYLAHGDAPEYAEMLQERLQERLNLIEILKSRVGPVVGTHAGPRIAGTVVWRDA